MAIKALCIYQTTPQSIDCGQYNNSCSEQLQDVYLEVSDSINVFHEEQIMFRCLFPF